MKKSEGNRFLSIVSHKILEEEINAKKAQVTLGKLCIGDIMKGVVKSIANYGVFVTLSPGIDGLVHITDVSWKKIHNLNEIISVGQPIDVKILDISHQSNGKVKIALGHKQLTPKPWETLDSNLSVGDVVSGVVCDIQDYGVFVEIPCGVEGLIHKTEIIGGKEFGNPHDYTVGNMVKAKVISLDRENEKMLLSFKQLSDDPWNKVEDKVSIGQIVHGTINTITNFGVFVELSEGIHGLVHVSELSWFKLHGKPKDIYQIGESLDVKVMHIDKENKKIELSLKKVTPNPWPGLNELQDKIVDVTVLEVTKKGIRTTVDTLSVPGYIHRSRYNVPESFSVGMQLKCKIHEVSEKQGLIILDLINNGL